MYRATVKLTLREWSCDYVSLCRVSTEIQSATNAWTTFWWYPCLTTGVCHSIMRILSKNTHLYEHRTRSGVRKNIEILNYQTRLTKYRVLTNLRCRGFDVGRIAPCYVYHMYVYTRCFIIRSETQFRQFVRQNNWYNVSGDGTDWACKSVIYNIHMHNMFLAHRKIALRSPRCACKNRNMGLVYILIKYAEKYARILMDI